jgi:hypothetical protein
LEAGQIKGEAKATAEAASNDKEDGEAEPADGKEKLKVESLQIDTPAASPASADLEDDLDFLTSHTL